VLQVVEIVGALRIGPASSNRPREQREAHHGASVRVGKKGVLSGARFLEGASLLLARRERLGRGEGLARKPAEEGT
jgi:hypothetical protein